MKTIVDLTDDREFMAALYCAVDAVSALMADTKAAEIMRTKPTLNGDETDAEKAAAIEEQTRKNIKAVFKAMMLEQPEKTAAAIRSMIFPADGESYPARLQLMTAGMKIINNRDVIDFFVSLAASGLLT